MEGLAGRLRREGVRASAGPWTVCAKTVGARGGRMVFALGKVAGRATARSRIRRIARDVFANTRAREAGVDLLLLVRGDVGRQPRRRVRATLAALLTRALEALQRGETRTREHA